VSAGARIGRQSGLSLIEMMVTLLIGAFLMIGVISMFSQTRNTYRTNDTVARMQENARYVLSQMEPDVRLTGSWGMQNEGPLVQVPAAIAVTCPDGTDVSAWVLDPLTPVAASNSTYNLPCPAPGATPYRAGTDVLVLRHASSGVPAPVPTVGAVQIHSNRVAGRVVNNGSAPPAGWRVFNWETNAYYVSSGSSLGAGVPSLRRKTLVNGVWQDEELVAGVENFQVELGVDTNGDDAVDRYVDPNNALVNPLAATSKILAVRLWLLLRAEQAEGGFQDAATYNFANVVNYQPADGFRRELLNKTIVLRNIRG
jgi:type IV pilus assembly protein PilW